jgi:hypothetical protein
MRRPRSILIVLGTTAVVAGSLAGPASALPVSPDARDAAVAASPGPSPVVGSPDAVDARDAAAGNVRSPYVVVLDEAGSTSSGGGFEWSDAVLGGGVVLGLTLLGTGAALSVRRHHRMTPLAH